MTIFYLGLILFFGLHLYSAFRSRAPEMDIKRKWGESKYMGLYSLISVIGFAAMVWGYSLAPPTKLIIDPIDGGLKLLPGLMAVALVLLCAAQLPTGYIKKTARHPMLLAVIVWSIAHLLTGADMAETILFGSFLLFSIIDLVAVSRRDAQDNKAETSPKWHNDLASVLISAVAFLALTNGLHNWLFGSNALY